LSIGGKGFFIVAADTRLSQGYSIVTREANKIVALTD